MVRMLYELVFDFASIGDLRTKAENVDITFHHSDDASQSTEMISWARSKGHGERVGSLTVTIQLVGAVTAALQLWLYKFGCTSVFKRI